MSEFDESLKFCMLVPRIEDIRSDCDEFHKKSQHIDKVYTKANLTNFVFHPWFKSAVSENAEISFFGPFTRR